MNCNINNKEEEILIYKDRILNNINKLVYNNGWTIQKFSEKAQLPYESVKKIMAGKINNPSIYTLIKISKAFGCGIDYLVGIESEFGISSANLPPRAFTLLREIANFEIYLHEHNQSGNKVTTIVPTGTIRDGMLFDSIFLESTDISAYTNYFNNIIMCGVKIIGRELHPTYLNDDILLIGRDRFPNNGEIGIFILDNKAYIRKYIVSDHVSLIPINAAGTPIEITNIDEVHFFGRILTIIRK